MAKSHLCLGCGRDLARVRARRETHYGLPIVTCPACGSVAVRRRHPLEQRWRQIRSLAWSLGILAAQLAALALLVTFVMIACIGLTDEWRRGSLPRWPRENVLATALGLGALAVASGAWLTSGLRHWRRAAAFLAFAILVACLLSIDTVLGPRAERLLESAGADVHADPIRPDILVVRLAVLAMIMAAAPLGVPLGRGLLGAARHAGGLRRARRRSILRARRATL